MKKIAALLMILILTLSMCMPGFARNKQKAVYFVGNAGGC